VLVRVVLAGCALAALVAAGPATAAPAGFRGTLSIAHSFAVLPTTPGLQSEVTGPGLRATYHLSGRRSRSRFAPPNSYLMTGRGHEELDLRRRDLKQGEGGTADLTFVAQAAGEVRLLRRPDGPRETSGLVLRLRPGGRFTLELIPLLGGENGLPLEYTIDRSDSQDCVTTPGTMAGRQTYSRGVFSVREIQHCPDGEPFGGQRIGRPTSPTIWGANVWAPPEAGFWQPDVCRGTVSYLRVLRVCGRVRDGRMAGRSVVGGRNVVDGGRLGYPTRGLCAFFPRGGRGEELPDPTDGIYEGCSRIDLGADWHRRTVVRWSFRPTR
jgi:hypothetical protein